ncbi:MAG: methyltransferase [Candidatus Thermoplasmatota archaeon]|nr:methyltransferase [Candidatus Thermoplasmatota archaeon]
MNKKSSTLQFHFNKLTINLHPEVYEPAEDTFQILETIKISPKKKLFELGTGCGIIALHCAYLGANVVCSDINPYAIELARKNFIANKHLLSGNVDIRYGDLFSVLHSKELFDVIIFNPPYLPTNNYDTVGKTGWFDIATDGGHIGLELTKRYIENVEKFLSPLGKAYVLISSLSKKDKINQIFSKCNLKYKIESQRNYDDEYLYVYCLKRKV